MEAMLGVSRVGAIQRLATGSGNFHTSTAGLVGGQLGYNWQIGSAVLGIETDADWMNLKGNTAGLAGVCLADGGGLMPDSTKPG